MAKISEYLKKIKEAVYGYEVRDAIHDSIEQCYSDVTTAKTLANEAALKIDNFANDILTDEDIDAAISAAEEE